MKSELVISGGCGFAPGAIISVGDEIARVVSITNDTLTVQWQTQLVARVTGASDADAVALVLAGFVADGDAWLWREGA